VTLSGVAAPASIALRVMETHKLLHHSKAEVQEETVSSRHEAKYYKTALHVQKNLVSI